MRTSTLWTWTRGALACALLLGVQVSGVARAAPKDGPPERAVELYQRGSEHYQAGRYHDAITDLKAALALDPESPNLLYNVARVSELLGNVSEAIEYYERYVELLPGSQAAERDEAQATIRRLEGARAELSAQAQAGGLREPVIVEVEAPPLGKADLLFWATAGLGVVAIAGAATTGVMALQREKAVRDFVAGPDGSVGERAALTDEANALALGSDLLWATGALSLVGAVSLYFLRDPEANSPSEDAPAAQIELHGAGLRLSGRF